MSLLKFASIFAIVVVSFANAAAERPPISSTASLDCIGTSCYLFERFPTQFLTAERLCRIQGGHLATIAGVAQNSGLRDAAADVFDVTSFSTFWIGYDDLTEANSWHWLSGSGAQYTHWSNDDSDADADAPDSQHRCAAMKLVNGKWRVENCFDRRPYACELPRLPDTPQTSTEASARTTDEIIVPTCQKSWTYWGIEEGGSETCYRVYPGSNWLENLALCESQNATLMTVRGTDRFLRALIYMTRGTPNLNDATIGLREVRDDKGGRHWTWVEDGARVSDGYTNWAPNEPSATADKPLQCGIYITSVPPRDENFGRWKAVACDDAQARAICTQKPKYVPADLLDERL